ncbi:hypothetical protein HK096_011212 [Nowakowskiella sp. JEL0078]|nr:hypothetical protein HK096_011212 [Nowakowskiella sp. JEL0078]
MSGVSSSALADPASADLPLLNEETLISSCSSSSDSEVTVPTSASIDATPYISSNDTVGIDIAPIETTTVDDRNSLLGITETAEVAGQNLNDEQIENIGRTEGDVESVSESNDYQGSELPDTLEVESIQHDVKIPEKINSLGKDLFFRIMLLLEKPRNFIISVKAFYEISKTSKFRVSWLIHHENLYLKQKLYEHVLKITTDNTLNQFILKKLEKFSDSTGFQYVPDLLSIHKLLSVVNQNPLSDNKLKFPARILTESICLELIKHYSHPLTEIKTPTTSKRSFIADVFQKITTGPLQIIRQNSFSEKEKNIVEKDQNLKPIQYQPSDDIVLSLMMISAIRGWNVSFESACTSCLDAVKHQVSTPAIQIPGLKQLFLSLCTILVEMIKNFGKDDVCRVINRIAEVQSIVKEEIDGTLSLLLALWGAQNGYAWVFEDPIIIKVVGESRPLLEGIVGPIILLAVNSQKWEVVDWILAKIQKKDTLNTEVLWWQRKQINIVKRQRTMRNLWRAVVNIECKDDLERNLDIFEGTPNNPNYFYAELLKNQQPSDSGEINSENERYNEEKTMSFFWGKAMAEAVRILIRQPTVAENLTFNFKPVKPNESSIWKPTDDHNKVQASLCFSKLLEYAQENFSTSDLLYCAISLLRFSYSSGLTFLQYSISALPDIPIFGVATLYIALEFFQNNTDMFSPNVFSMKIPLGIFFLITKNSIDAGRVFPLFRGLKEELMEKDAWQAIEHFIRSQLVAIGITNIQKKCLTECERDIISSPPLTWIQMFGNECINRPEAMQTRSLFDPFASQERSRKSVLDFLYGISQLKVYEKQLQNLFEAFFQESNFEALDLMVLVGITLEKDRILEIVGKVHNPAKEFLVDSVLRFDQNSHISEYDFWISFEALSEGYGNISFEVSVSLSSVV